MNSKYGEPGPSQLGHCNAMRTLAQVRYLPNRAQALTQPSSQNSMASGHLGVSPSRHNGLRREPVNGCRTITSPFSGGGPLDGVPTSKLNSAAAFFLRGLVRLVTTLHQACWIELDGIENRSEPAAADCLSKCNE
jgi:hypothetical protein